MDYPKTVANVNLLNGKFTDGDPAAGVPASLDPAEWANLVTDEILNVLSAGNIVPDETQNAQLLAAIQAVITGRFTSTNQLLAQSGYQKLPGGLIIQWGKFTYGNYTANTTTNSPITFPIAFPNAGLVAAGSPNLGITTTVGLTLESISTTGMNIRYVNGTAISSLTITWIALGY